MCVYPTAQPETAVTDPAATLAHLDAVRAETLRRLAAVTQAELDWVPAVRPEAGEAAWSLGAIFMHLAIDQHYLRELICRPLIEGVAPPEAVSFLPPPPPYGTPQAVIRFWLERARLQTRRLLEAWPPDANETLTHSGGLEPMTGGQWLLAYAGHEAFHHQQLDALLAEIRATESWEPADAAA